MKKSAFVILLIGSLLTGMNVANAASSKAKKAKARHVSMAEQKNLLGTMVSGALSDYASNSIVSLNVRVTEQNTISVVEINTEDKELEKTLIKALQGKKIKGNNENVSLVMTLEIVPEVQESSMVF